MKKIKERKIGEIFKYRHNIVKVCESMYSQSCGDCQFKNQNKSYACRYSTIGIHRKYIPVKCAIKHNCLFMIRNDRKSVFFKKIEFVKTVNKK